MTLARFSAETLTAATEPECSRNSCSHWASDNAEDSQFHRVGGSARRQAASQRGVRSQIMRREDMRFIVGSKDVFHNGRSSARYAPNPASTSFAAAIVC